MNLKSGLAEQVLRSIERTMASITQPGTLNYVANASFVGANKFVIAQGVEGHICVKENVLSRFTLFRSTLPEC